jgi:hypothetical protein
MNNFINIFLSSKILNFFLYMIILWFVLSLNTNPPKIIRKVFSNSTVRILILLIIFYKSQNDMKISITLTIIYLIIQIGLSNHKIKKIREKFMNL